MAWITPFKNWIASRVPLPSDFNRIEGNIDYLKERGDADRTLTLTGDVSGATTYDDNSGISVITTVADNSHNHVTDNITDATSNNSANKIVKRDSAGNFIANIITATLNGLASAATKLATARTISISGNASGSTSFDGSGNADISLTVAHAAQAAKLQTARTLGISGHASGSMTFDGSSDAYMALTVNNIRFNKYAIDPLQTYKVVFALSDGSQFIPSGDNLKYNPMTNNLNVIVHSSIYATDTSTVQGINLGSPPAGTYSEHTISVSSTWAIPAGTYSSMVVTDSGVHLQINSGSGWFGAFPPAGMIMSDGSNYRIYNTTAAAQTVYYRKMW